MSVTARRSFGGVGIVAHFKPFARAEAGAPSHRRDDDEEYDYDYDDDSYHEHRHYSRYRHRGLLGDLLGL
jgi:hypothetical protein